MSTDTSTDKNIIISIKNQKYVTRVTDKLHIFKHINSVFLIYWVSKFKFISFLSDADG